MATNSTPSIWGIWGDTPSYFSGGSYGYTPPTPSTQTTPTFSVSAPGANISGISTKNYPPLTTLPPSGGVSGTGGTSGTRGVSGTGGTSGTTGTPGLTPAVSNFLNTINSLLSGISKNLTTIYYNLSSGGGGGISGGGSRGSGISGGGQQSWLPGLNATISPSRFLSNVSPSQLLSTTSTTLPGITGIPASVSATAESGLASSLTETDKEKLNKEQRARLSVNTPATRESLWDKIKGFFTPPEYPATPPTGTTTTTKPSPMASTMGTTRTTGEIGTYIDITTGLGYSGPRKSPYDIPVSTTTGKVSGTTGKVSGTTGKVSGTTGATGVTGGTTRTTSPDFNQVVTETTNQFAEIKPVLDDINNRVNRLIEDFQNQAQQGQVPEDWYNRWQNEFKTMRDTYYQKINPISTQIDEIDNILLKANEGFRKAAEEIRNNPDLTVWQQARRLKELEDLQNYAPIFNGLSYKDLVTYRQTLAESLNRYIDAYNSVVGTAASFDLNVENYKLNKKSEDISNLSRILGISQTILDLQQQLSNVGYNQSSYIDDKGRLHEYVTYTDPRTHQVSVVSDKIVGTTREAPRSVAAAPDTLSLFTSKIYPQISSLVSSKKPLRGNDYVTLLAQWHNLVGSDKYDSDFDKYLKVYGVYPTTSSSVSPFYLLNIK